MELGAVRSVALVALEGLEIWSVFLHVVSSCDLGKIHPWLLSPARPGGPPSLVWPCRCEGPSASSPGSLPPLGPAPTSALALPFPFTYGETGKQACSPEASLQLCSVRAGSPQLPPNWGGRDEGERCVFWPLESETRPHLGPCLSPSFSWSPVWALLGLGLA